MPTHLHRYDIPGHVHFLTFSTFRRLTFFWHDAIKQVAIDAMRLIQTQFSICVVGYVTMPEHIHLLVYPHSRGIFSPVPISSLLYTFKKHVGFHGKRKLKDLAEEKGALWSSAMEEWLKDRRPFWQTRGYDFNIDRFDTLVEKLNYCHKNPLTRGLVNDAADWRWSSYRYYEFGDESIIKLDWDKAWPIQW
jgi:putative transposase